MAKGQSVKQVSKQLEVTVQAYYSRRKDYGGLRMDQCMRLRDLEKKNACVTEFSIRPSGGRTSINENKPAHRAPACFVRESA